MERDQAEAMLSVFEQLSAADRAAVRSFAEFLLHQARGALQLAETYGAALLAEEMELACKYLAALRPGKGREDGLDALTRAMVQLPSYIERLLGDRD